MRVLVLGGGLNYNVMFNSLGFSVVEDISQADLVCFTGGADVSPSLYGEDAHKSTACSINRDRYEETIYKQCLNKRLPMVGICRGGQFLHVMNGGKLWQDVDGHAVWGTHAALDLTTNTLVRVTSTHHQMMRMTDDSVGEVLCIAKESTYKVNMLSGEEMVVEEDTDVEVVSYKDTKCLCFQPHPELVGADSTYLYFKNLLTNFLGEDNA